MGLIPEIAQLHEMLESHTVQIMKKIEIKKIKIERTRLLNPFPNKT